MSAQSQTDSFESLYLSEGDVSKLMECLVEVSDKWEEIGLVLGLASHTRSDCSTRNNTLSLTNILCEWVKGNQPQEQTTLNKLKLALESPLVGRGRVAQKMVERFTAVKKPLAAKKPLPANKPLPAKKPFASKKPLEAKKPLAAKKPLTAKKPSAKKSLPAKNQQLVDLYSVCKEIPADTWPPARAATFINLVLINKKKQETGDYNYSVRGDIDDVIARKEKIEYDEVFGQYQRGALILVEGRPGSGKTMLVHKVTRDWATTGKVLSNANLVFLIPLRNLAEGCDESLTDILAMFYLDREDRKKEFSNIKRSNGEGVCFIIDGLDEYQPQNESTSVIYRLLRKTYLPKAMVIVASRPVATSKLLQEAPVTKQIEVLGFCQQQIFEYIGKFPFPRKSDVSNLSAYLESHRNILHMCYLPVHTSMICYLFQEKGDIPSTETKIYERFTRYIVLRKLTRSNQYAQLHSMADLCGTDKEYFRIVCLLAYDMTLRSKQVVHKCDTHVTLNREPGSNDAASLGLITIDITAQQYGRDETYTFLHLTFQEYLTAVHLATLDEEEQMEIIRMHGGEPQMRNVWKFYCGMVDFKGKVARIQQIISCADPLYRVQCAFESQQAVVCDLVIQLEAGVLSFSKSTLTPADLTAVGYAISTTSHTVTKLDMTDCGLLADHVKVFLSEVSYNKLKCIQDLNLMHNYIRADGVATLAEALKSCNNLHTLDLYGNNIGPDGVAALAEALKSCNNLQDLDLSANNIGDDGVAALAVALKSCNNLQALGLRANNIGPDGVAALAAALKFCNNLQVLVLTANNIGPDGVPALANALSCCNNLQGLELSANNIGPHGAVNLAAALMSCKNLQSLGLTANNIGDNGLAALSEALKSYDNLQGLELSANKIGPDGAAALAEALRSCNNPQALGIGATNIVSHDVAALAEKSCNNLQVLNLSVNNIGPDGVAALAESLKFCNNLQTLGLRANNIGPDGAAALAEALKSCNKLQGLYLEDNNIGAEGRAALADLDKRITTCLY